MTGPLYSFLLGGLKKKDLAQVREAIHDGARVKADHPLLHECMQMSLDLRFFEALIDKGGADVNETLTGVGSTILMKAAWHGNVDLVRLLIKNGANLNTRDEDGLTALHYAVWAGHAEDKADAPAITIARMLLKAGADTRIKSNKNRDALELAEFLIRPAMHELLKEHDSRLQRRLDMLDKMAAACKRKAFGHG